MRRWRANHPYHAQFNWLRRSAQKRDIAFRLTYDQFVSWAMSCDYLAKVGKTAGCYHCDRIDASRGYEVGNLQLLPVAVSCAKDQWRRGWRLRAGLESGNHETGGV